MEHKVKIVKVLERHKIHPKAKAQMNIPLCCMISMLVVKPTFKIDVLKMEHVFQVGCQAFYVFSTNWQGEEAFVANHIREQDNHCKVVNASFEEGLNSNEDLQRFNGKMFYVWDGNHQLQAWMPYISRVHLHDLFWHIPTDSIMLDMRGGVIHLLVTMIDMNK